MRKLGRGSLAFVLAAAAACGSSSGGSSGPAIANHPGGGATTGARGVLTSATSIEVRDVWVGLGCTHDFSGRLTAVSGGFHGDVTLTAGWGDDAGRQATVTVPIALIERLEEAVEAARAAMAGKPVEPDPGLQWTDDYPSGSMTFTGPRGTYRLGFTDQHRKLVLDHDGESTPVDRPHGLGDDDGGTPAVWTAYTAVLEAAQLRQMLAEQCDRGR